GQVVRDGDRAEGDRDLDRGRAVLGLDLLELRGLERRVGPGEVDGPVYQLGLSVTRADRLVVDRQAVLIGERLAPFLDQRRHERRAGTVDRAARDAAATVAGAARAVAAAARGSAQRDSGARGRHDEELARNHRSDSLVRSPPTRRLTAPAGPAVTGLYRTCEEPVKPAGSRRYLRESGSLGRRASRSG